MNPPLDSEYHQQTDTEYHEQVDNSILVDNTEMEESTQESLTTYLGKSCSFCLPRVPFVNCRQFMYLVISLLILRAGYGIWLYQFLIIAYLFTLTELPIPPTAKPLRQGRWHSADDLYQIIMQPSEVNPDVPPGDKSNCYLLVDNERNMKRLATGNNKKCDFYDNCGTWDHEKGNTVKTTYIVIDGSLRHVELKNKQYSTKKKSSGFH